MHPFYVALGQGSASKGEYEFMAPTTSRNCFRILRAMQLRKPIMLEGLPGVGKTSLIEALAAASGESVFCFWPWFFFLFVLGSMLRRAFANASAGRP